MFDILLLALAFYTVYTFGFRVGYRTRNKETLSMLRFIANGGDEQDDLPPNKIVAKVEKHGDMYYLFDSADDSFLVQGKDWEEITEITRKKYSGKKEIVVETELAKEVGLL